MKVECLKEKTEELIVLIDEFISNERNKELPLRKCLELMNFVPQTNFRAYVEIKVNDCTRTGFVCLSDLGECVKLTQWSGNNYYNCSMHEDSVVWDRFVGLKQHNISIYQIYDLFIEQNDEC